MLTSLYPSLGRLSSPSDSRARTRPIWLRAAMVTGVSDPHQVDRFLAIHPVADPRVLYIVFGGSTDLRELAPRVAQGSAPPTDAVLPVGNLVMAITELANAGARTFLVPTQPDLGQIPEALHGPPGAPALATQLSLLFNGALTTSLATLEDTLGVDIRLLDTFALLHTVIARPAAFGLTNASDACLQGDPFHGGTPCANPDTYVFWDSIHPTAAGHALLAEAALPVVIPEPSAWLLLATGCVGLLVLGWRHPV